MKAVNGFIDLQYVLGGVVMAQRNRATGWQHAKLSGHKNEDLVKKMLDTNENFKYNFLKRVGKHSNKIKKTTIGGLHETNVPSVNGNKTKRCCQIFY